MEFDGFEPDDAASKKVLTATVDIPFGEVRSYGDVARIVGRPSACRFVVTTMANNPYPILIPCHRVVRNDGSLGKFGGGTELKKLMIALEAENKNPRKIPT